MRIFITSGVDIFHSGGGGKISSRTIFNYLTKYGHEMKFIPNLDKLKKELKVFKPDLVLHHNIRGLEKVVKVCNENNVPVIPTINGLIACPKGTQIIGDGFGKIKYTYNFFEMLKYSWQGQYAMKEPFMYRLKVVFGAPIRFIRMKQRFNALNNASAVITIGKTSKKILEMNGVKNKIYVCPQPIDDALIEGEHEKKKQIFFGSALDSTKGALVLLKAFNKLLDEFPDYKLLMIGHMYYKIDEKKFNPYLNENVIVRGRIPEDEFKQLMCESEVLVFPSLLLEPFGRIWAEAAAYGVCVLGIKNRGGPSDYLSDEEAYFVEDNMESLVSGLRTLLNDKELREKLGRNAREFAKENLVASKVVRKLESIYREVL